MGADEPGDDRRLLRPDPSATERRAYRRLPKTHVRERKTVGPLGISRGVAGQHCARPGAYLRMAPSVPTPSAAHAASGLWRTPSTRLPAPGDLAGTHAAFLEF